MPYNPKKTNLVVEEGTIKGDTSYQHPPRACGKLGIGDELPQVVPVRPQRFRNGKLTAVAGIPVRGAKPTADADVYAEGSAGDYVDEFVEASGYNDVSAAEHHALSMMADAEASGDWDTYEVAYDFIAGR